MQILREHSVRRLASSLAAAALLGLVGAPAAAERVFQTAPVTKFFGDGVAVPINDQTGAAWLNRGKSRIQGRVMTRVRQARVAYTVWIVLFNNPMQCAPPGCAGMDLGNPAVEGVVYYGNGAISAHGSPQDTRGGVINLDISMTDEGLPKGLFRLDDALENRIPFWADGLNHGNGLCAEIHLVIDQHATPFNKRGFTSWVADLTSTVFPGTGMPAGMVVSNHRVAVFPATDHCGMNGD